MNIRHPGVTVHDHSGRRVRGGDPHRQLLALAHQRASRDRRDHLALTCEEAEDLSSSQNCLYSTGCALRTFVVTERTYAQARKFMKAYDGIPLEPPTTGVPQKYSFFRSGRRRSRQQALQASEETRLGQEGLLEKLTSLSAGMDTQLDRLSGAVDDLTRPPQEPEPTPEEQLGRLFLELMGEGLYQGLWFHTAMASHVTEDTAPGVRLAAKTILAAQRDNPLPDWAVRAFTRLAEDPL